MREGIMLAYPFEEKRLLTWRPPYVVQPKLDGERCRALGIVSETGVEWNLISSQLNIFSSVPHIVEALRAQVTIKGHSLELDGELYLHGSPFEDIHSIVGRTVNLSPDYRQMEYCIFDIVSADPQYARLLQLHVLEDDLKPPLRVVDFRLCETLDEVMGTYDLFISMGYEGIIVRHFENQYERKRSTAMMKFKPKKSDIYRIIGFNEEVSIKGEPKGRMGSLVCIAPDGGASFAVGTGMTDEKREELWTKRYHLIGNFVQVGYQHITSGSRVPRFPVFLDLLEASDG